MSSFMAFFRPPDIHHQGKAGKVFRSSAGRKLIDVWKWDIFTSVCSIFMGASRDQLPVRRGNMFPSCFLYASKLQIFPYIFYGKQGRAPDVLLGRPCLPWQMPKGQTMQQGIQIVSGVVQGRFLLRQQPRRRIEHEATSVFGRRSCYLAISVQSVR